MAQYFEVHPENPQPRLLKQAAALLHKGGVLAVPTDSSYALVCHLDDKNAADQGKQSITPYLISLMPKDKAARIMYLMTQI